MHNKHRSDYRSKQFRANRQALQLEPLEKRLLMAGIADLVVQVPDPAALSSVDQHATHNPQYILPADSCPAVEPGDLTSSAEVFEESRDWRHHSELITTLAQVTTPAGKTPPAREADHVLPKGKNAPPRSLPRLMPNGLFPDGSVRTINPDIDPRVLKQLQQGGQAPIPETIHRPGVGYGAPTNTLAGLDPTLRLLLEMKPNWEHGVGQMIHTYHGIKIHPGNGMPTQQQLFSWLQDFSHFNPGNIATVKLIKPSPLDAPEVANHYYLLFHPLPVGKTQFGDELIGTLNSIQSVVNGPQVAVRLFVDAINNSVTGVTLEGHMLVGARIWGVRSLPGGDLVVETEAWVQRNGQLNNVAMQYGGQFVMGTVWTRYLENIGKAASRDGGSWEFLPATIRSRPGMTHNPLQKMISNKHWNPPIFQKPFNLPR
jgi:hypothetical protein